jgi:hypothetical protein
MKVGDRFYFSFMTGVVDRLVPQEDGRTKLFAHFEDEGCSSQPQHFATPSEDLLFTVYR